MNAKPLSLDFRRAPAMGGWARWLLVAAALFFTVDLGWSYRSLKAEVARKEARLVASPRSARTGPAEARLPLADEMQSARESIRRLGTPWQLLFGAVEAVRGHGVALMAIEPSAENRTVVITGEARDYPGLLRWVASLERNGGLREVYLQRHEVLANDPRQPVAFSVSASWQDLP